MAGLFNRFKSRRGVSGSISQENESTSALTFDEEGFVCPTCHQKFLDPKQLAQHFADTHFEEKNTNNTPTENKEVQKDLTQEIELWKQQFTASEESRILLSKSLMNEKQHANDLEEELQLIQRHLKTTQAKVAEQSQEIANFKATKDVYDAQFSIFTNELLAAQNLIKDKQQQIEILTLKSSNDDVDLLQNELIAIQQRMNDITLDKEIELERLRIVLRENQQFFRRLDPIERTFEQNLVMYDELIGKYTSDVLNEMKRTRELVQSSRQRIQNLVRLMQTRLIENQTEFIQLKQTNYELQEEKFSTNQMIDDLQKQVTSSRNQIEQLNDEINQLENKLRESNEEKIRFFQNQTNGEDQHDERQNLFRQITMEKDQYEQQVKEYRIQIKQINNERQKLQEEFEQINQRLNIVSNEKTKFQNEINLLKNQLETKTKDHERQMTEVSTMREQYITMEKKVREVNELNNTHKSLQIDFTERINRLTDEKLEVEQILNRTKLELNTIQKEKDSIVQQLQNKLAQLHTKLDDREVRIKRLSFGIHRRVVTLRKMHEYIQEKIHPRQMNILSIIEQAKNDCRLIGDRTREEIREEFCGYLSIFQRKSLDSKANYEKQMDDFKSKLAIEQEKYTKLVEEGRQQKEKYEKQLTEWKTNFAQLSESKQTVDRQCEKYEKQISAFERELDSRTKRHEMQLTALTENLASVRSELKLTNEKLATIEQIKAEKADLEARLAVGQDERRVLLERSLLSENRVTKLLADNGVLTKKTTELESALQEIAREYQVLQIQADKLRQRRWLDDDDVDACMKCHQTFSVTQRKHHCRNCGNIFCDNCSSKTAIIAAASRKQKRVCDQCYKDLIS